MLVTGRYVVEQEGVLGLWRGLGPSLARTVPGIGIYFSCMEWLKSLVCGSTSPSAVQALAIGFFARSVAGTIMIPVTVVKTRVEAGRGEYRGMRRALVALHRTEGVKGLCLGLLPTLVRDSPYSGLYLMFYEKLKYSWPELRVENESTPTWWLFSCGVVAGVAACGVTHPADVVKTRVQLDARVGVVEAVRGVYREAGLRGFMLGVVPRMARRTVMTALSWTLYEKIKKQLKDL